MTRDEIVTETRRWLRTPYRHHGRDTRGVDCLGLLVMIGRRFEIPHADEQDYSAFPRSDHYILHKLAGTLRRLPPTRTPLPGTVGVFAENRLPCHAGVFSERFNELHLIHARMRPAQVIEECWRQMKGLRLIGLFDFPGIE